MPTDIPVPVRFAPRHGGRGARCHDRARDAEVREHRVPFLEQNVLRLDVAVDDSLAMRVRERVRDLHENAHRIAHRELAASMSRCRSDSPRTYGIT